MCDLDLAHISGTGLTWLSRTSRMHKGDLAHFMTTRKSFWASRKDTVEAIELSLRLHAGKMRYIFELASEGDCDWRAAFPTRFTLLLAQEWR